MYFDRIPSFFELIIRECFYDFVRGQKVFTLRSDTPICRGSIRLFMFFMWYLTELCETNNIKAYKGKKSMNYILFEQVINYSWKIDRKVIQDLNIILKEINKIKAETKSPNALNILLSQKYKEFPKGYKLITEVADKVVKKRVVKFRNIL